MSFRDINLEIKSEQIQPKSTAQVPKKSSGAFPYDSGSPTNTSAEQDQQGVYIQQQRHVNGRFSL